MMDERGGQQILDSLAQMAEEFSTAPALEDMARRTLDDKLIAGPTSAHVIEEVHTPLNVAYVTFTTGSTAFQNVVGVTYPELPARAAAGKAALERAGACEGDDLLVCYPPLVNVFSRGAFDELGVRPLFLPRSSRDAFLVALCQKRPRLVIGESSFLRTALEDAKRLGVWELLPHGTAYLAAGTPLDQELIEVVAPLSGRVHDLYGCQEFGWLAMDGVPLRNDVTLVEEGVEGAWRSLVVGGLPTGDSFPVGGHVLDPEGVIPTYARRRSHPELEVVVRACTAQSAMTVERAARSILRLKGRVVRVHPEVKVGAIENVLDLVSAWPGEGSVATVSGLEQTALFQSLIEAQEQYQAESKSDPLWLKRR